MRPPYAVIFTKYNAVIRKLDPSNIPDLGSSAVLNPRLSHLLSVPPHFWKRQGNHIVEMTVEEKAARRLELASAFIDNRQIKIRQPLIEPLPTYSKSLGLVVLSVIFGVAALLWLM